MFFKEIRPTEHYLKFHQREVSWDKVVELIFETKQKKKKGDKIEIRKRDYYLLCELKDRTLWVINAKKSK